MRIIVTRNGMNELSSIVSPKNQVLNRPGSISNFVKNARTNSQSSSSLAPQYELSRSSSMPQIPSTTRTRTIKTIASNASNLGSVLPKIIKIKQVKIVLDKKKSELYEEDKIEKPIIVKQTPDIYLSMSTKSSKGLPILKSKYSLEEIINEETFKKLKNKLIKEQDLNSHDQLIDEKWLRKENKDKKILEEVEKDKHKLIDAENTNLIEYLISKKTITEQFLKNLNSFNDKKMEKINKVCQKILMKNDKEALMREIIREKIKGFQRREQESYRKDLNRMSEVINSSSSRLGRKLLNFKELKKENFKRIHREFAAKFWGKNDNFQRFFHKKQRTCSSDISF